jgi:predicted 3-demethylubiquinone-9 3-methyltransferase (glyoxalase superfamily)
MHTITPHLWFDTEAKEAAARYTSLFPNSGVKSTVTLHDTPSGDADIVTIELVGQEFILLNAGPLFTFNPSVSFLVACETPEEVDMLWEKLSEGGKPLMELGSYPFSERYGWLQDTYGLSWQLMYMGKEKIVQKITPTLMFVGDMCGKAEEAITFYTSIFHSASIDHIMRYEKGEGPDAEGTVKHTGFTLEGQQFAAMDSAYKHDFAFNEAISFIVNCENQEEIDYYWDRLSADAKAEQCGWLKDKYGLSWQIVPSGMEKFFATGDKEQIAQVTKAFLEMKKIDIAALERIVRKG